MWARAHREEMKGWQAMSFWRELASIAQDAIFMSSCVEVISVSRNDMKVPGIIRFKILSI
jgi:hypothetical protein